MCDTIVYSTIIPVMPFQLKRMGYHDIPSLLGWLLFAYVCYSSLLSRLH